MKLFIITFLSLLLSNHSNALDTSSLKQTMNECKKLINSSQLGQHVSQIMWPFHQDNIIKQPSKMLVDGKSIVTYYCRIAWIEDGRMTDDEYTPFVFINNELSAIGWESLGGPQTRGASQAEIGYDDFKEYQALDKSGGPSVKELFKRRNYFDPSIYE